MHKHDYILFMHLFFNVSDVKSDVEMLQQGAYLCVSKNSFISFFSSCVGSSRPLSLGESLKKNLRNQSGHLTNATYLLPFLVYIG